MNTPRPWKMHEFKPYGCRIYSPDCYIIATTSSGLNEDWIGSNPLGDAGAKSNAELIVRAVNSFDDLLAACKAAEGTVDLFARSGTARSLAIQKQLKAAIAKAENP